MVRLAFLTIAATLGCRTPAPSSVEGASVPPSPDSTPVSANPVPTELQGLRRRIDDLVAQGELLARKAHVALDQGHYDSAVALHKESLETAREADKLRANEAAMVRTLAGKFVEDLDADDLAVRESAMRNLIRLDIDPSLLRLLTKDLSPAAAGSLELVIERMEKGFNPRQWATGATASTEYGQSSWAALQATGEPNTPRAGDCSTAWASQAPDGDTEWLALTFDIPVMPALIRVHETYNAGAITKVEAKDATGAWRILWEGPARACETPRWFEVAVPKGKWTTREIRLTLDSDAVPGWNEIDAVELVGADPLKAAAR